MRIGLIRHGETDWNAAARLQGQVDIPLNERGIEQAQDAGRLLRGHAWTRIAASPLSRARHTAEIIGAALGLDAVATVPGVVERSFGELEGAHIYLETGARRPLDHHSIESIESVLARAIPAIVEAARPAAGTSAAGTSAAEAGAASAAEADDAEAGDLLLVTHGSVIRLVLTELLGERAPHISNLGLSILETDADAPHGLRVLSANGYPIARRELPVV